MAMTNLSRKTKKLTLRTSEADYEKIQSFANFYDQTLTAFVMDSVWKQIENYEDISAVEGFFANPDQKTIPHSDVVKEFCS